MRSPWPYICDPVPESREIDFGFLGSTVSDDLAELAEFAKPVDERFPGPENWSCYLLEVQDLIPGILLVLCPYGNRSSLLV